MAIIAGVISTWLLEKVNYYSSSKDLSPSRYQVRPQTYSVLTQKLYPLRLLKRAGVQEQDMLKVFRSSVRPILEHAVQVWQDIPDYLSDRIESVQKRAFKIICPNSPYSQTLSLANETTLSHRSKLSQIYGWDDRHPWPSIIMLGVHCCTKN